MFLDHLATDIEHLDRLNKLLREGQHQPDRYRGMREDATAGYVSHHAFG